MKLRRPTNRRVLSALLCAGAVALAACNPTPQTSFARPFAMDSLGGKGPDSTTSAGRGTAPRYAACNEIARADTASTSTHFLPDSTRNFLIKQGYYNWCIPEYHDVQRFRTPGRHYGPIAYSFASPNSSFYTSHTAFDGFYVNVAIVDVDPAAELPPAYRHLKLNFGHNCVFLWHRHTGATAHWEAAVGPPVTGNCAGASSSASSVPVDFEQPSMDADDYPPVTRFVEATNLVGAASPPATFLGVRCANAWCNLGHGGGVNPLPSTHSTMSGSGTSARWMVRGWSDDQHWAVGETGATPPVKPHTDPASVVPVDNLASFTVTQFDADWQYVADVNVPTGTLPAKYLSGYTLAEGRTKMWIKRYAPSRGFPDYRWFARFGPDPHVAGMPAFRVKYTDHSGSSYPMPGTARWRWRDVDEEIWVECAFGCCLIEQGPTGPPGA